jgi:hypothetical protein
MFFNTRSPTGRVFWFTLFLELLRPYGACHPKKIHPFLLRGRVFMVIVSYPIQYAATFSLFEMNF